MRQPLLGRTRDGHHLGLGGADLRCKFLDMLRGLSNVTLDALPLHRMADARVVLLHRGQRASTRDTSG